MSEGSCEGTSFELVHLKLRGSPRRLEAVQCERCGTLIGIVPKQQPCRRRAKPKLDWTLEQIHLIADGNDPGPPARVLKPGDHTWEEILADIEEQDAGSNPGELVSPISPPAGTKADDQ